MYTNPSNAHRVQEMFNLGLFSKASIKIGSEFGNNKKSHHALCFVKRDTIKRVQKVRNRSDILFDTAQYHHDNFILKNLSFSIQEGHCGM